MPSLHTSLKRGGAIGVSVVGFEEIYRALKAIEGGMPREVRAKLRAVGNIVKNAAAKNVTHKWPDRPVSIRLAESLKVSLTQKSASVYSTAPHGGAQNVGAMSKGSGPHITRAHASRYMNAAVDEKRSWVAAQMDEVLDWATAEFLT